MTIQLGLIDSESSFSLSNKETSHLVTKYFQVENFGFLKLTSNEQYPKTWYPTPDVVVDAGWFTLDIHNSTSGDFNNDGLMDLVFQPMLFPHVLKHQTPIYPIFLIQTPTGGFSDPLTILENSNFPNKDFLYRLAVGDFNADGITDASFSSMGIGDHNTGQSNYQSPLVVFGGVDPGLRWTDSFDNLPLWQGAPNWQLGYGSGHSLAVGDFNADGYSDWFSQWYVAYGQTGEKFSAIVVTPNDLAARSIAPWTSQWVWPTVNAAVAKDFNGDGYDDLVLSTMPNFSSDVNGGDLWLLFGSASGLQGGLTAVAINRKNDIPGNVGTNFIVAADFNGDGHNDLVYLEHYWTTDFGDTTHYYSKAKLKMLVGNGEGGFEDQSNFVKDPLGGHRHGEGNLHAMDVNGDGWIDLVLSGYGFTEGDIWGGQQSNLTSIFLNNQGRLEYLDPYVFAYVSSSQFTGEEDLKPWINDTLTKLLPVDIGSDGMVDFVGFVSTPLRSWPQIEQQYLYAYQVKSLAPLGRSNASEFLIGTDSIDRIWGYDGNDRLFAKQGNDLLDGGLGIDIAIYQGSYAQYAITQTGSGLTVADTHLERDGTDTLTNIERLQFTDTNIALDVGPTQNAGSLYMLYQAVFNREPDPVGMGYWLAHKDAGKDLATFIAPNFIASEEFIDQYGTNPSTATYVDRLYQNVLNRPGEPEGVAYWNAQLNSGLRSKAEVLVLFATLPEGASLVADLVANGIPYTEWVG